MEPDRLPLWNCDVRWSYRADRVPVAQRDQIVAMRSEIDLTGDCARHPVRLPWRRSAGNEIDVVVPDGDGRWALSGKVAASAAQHDASHIHRITGQTITLQNVGTANE